MPALHALSNVILRNPEGDEESQTLAQSNIAEILRFAQDDIGSSFKVSEPRINMQSFLAIFN